jgi:hypothetical protein
MQNARINAQRVAVSEELLEMCGREAGGSNSASYLSTRNTEPGKTRERERRLTSRLVAGTETAIADDGQKDMGLVS